MVALALICIPLYNEMFRGCFTVVERKNIKKLMINGEFVIEWKKEKREKHTYCFDHG